MSSFYHPLLAFVLCIMLFLGNGCTSTVSKEQAPVKLVKTIGDPKYGNVQCMLQDKAGNLWFGTSENGLYKFDGKSFTRYLKANGLMSNDIYCMLQDRAGIIWIGTGKGLCTYDGYVFTEINIPLPHNLPPNNNPNFQGSHWVYHIIQAKNEDIWLATIDGVFVYNGISFDRFPLDEAHHGFLTGNDPVERLLEDNAGNIWLGGRTNAGVYRYDGKTLTHLTPPILYQKGPQPKPLNWAWPQMQEANGAIWFSNWGGAYRYDGKSFTGFTTKDGLPGIVTHIIADKKGNIWLGGNGLTRYNGSTFTTFSSKDGLTDHLVWSVLDDMQGNIWIGTSATNLYQYNGKTIRRYSSYEHLPIKP